MALDRAQTVGSSNVWMALSALADADGSAAHPFARRMSQRNAHPRDLADAAHLICSLHGRHPGLLDLAAVHGDVAAATGWLDIAALAFADARARIVQLAVAAGPLPSTPGQAESEATVTSQRHALDMLAISDRSGCSLGAAFALVLDWGAVHAVLATAGERFGVEIPPPDFPSEADSATLIATIADSASLDRAILFGARQLNAQHHGLFDLLEARAVARGSD